MEAQSSEAVAEEASPPREGHQDRTGCPSLSEFGFRAAGRFLKKRHTVFILRGVVRLGRDTGHSLLTKLPRLTWMSRAGRVYSGHLSPTFPPNSCFHCVFFRTQFYRAQLHHVLPNCHTFAKTPSTVTPCPTHTDQCSSSLPGGGRRCLGDPGWGC